MDKNELTAIINSPLATEQQKQSARVLLNKAEPQTSGVFDPTAEMFADLIRSGPPELIAPRFANRRLIGTDPLWAKSFAVEREKI